MEEVRTKIWTDGGSRSNLPPFGDGYGSFRIGVSDKIVYTNYNKAMSANAAEILTIAFALNATTENKLIIFSDSQIALKWAKDAPFSELQISKKASSEMVNSIGILREAAKDRDIKVCWTPREQIFAIFGH